MVTLAKHFVKWQPKPRLACPQTGPASLLRGARPRFINGFTPSEFRPAPHNGLFFWIAQRQIVYLLLTSGRHRRTLNRVASDRRSQKFVELGRDTSRASAKKEILVGADK